MSGDNYPIMNFNSLLTSLTSLRKLTIIFYIVFSIFFDC